MSKQLIEFPWTGGMDQSKTPIRSELTSFNYLLNFRQRVRSVGELEQTPYFNSGSLPSAATYWTAAGGSATEPNTSAVLLLTQNVSAGISLAVTQHCVYNRSSGTAMQVFYQSVDTAVESVNTGCRLVINNVAGLAITLGSALEVDIDGAATFRWRKNGGAYTSLVPITTGGVSIDGGNATVYFLTASGFTIGTTWTWTRADASYEVLADTTTRALPHWHYGRETFFINVGQRVMVATINSASEKYVISVGYRPVYGYELVVYEDHLVVASYADSYAGVLTSRTVASSDLTDLHAFIPTDVNEADRYILPVSSRYAHTNDRPEAIGITQGLLFVFTRTEIFFTSYVGLPVPMAFKHYADFAVSNADFSGSNLPISVVPGNNGLFIRANTGLYFFNGTLQKLNGVDEFLRGQSGSRLSMVYDVMNDECICLTNAYLVVYQVATNSFYLRSASFDSANYCLGFTFTDTLNIGGANRKVRAEVGNGYATSWGIAPMMDSASGTAFATPTIITQGLFGKSRLTHDWDSVTLIAKTTVLSPDTGDYWIGSALKINIKWYNIEDGTLGTLSTDANAVWDSTVGANVISLPRTYVKGLAIRLEVAGTNATKPPAKVVVYGMDIQVKPQALER